MVSNCPVQTPSGLTSDLLSLTVDGLMLFLLSSRQLLMVQHVVGGSWLFCLLTQGTSSLSSLWPASRNAWSRSSTSSHICRASPTTRASSSHQQKHHLDSYTTFDISPTFVSTASVLQLWDHLILNMSVLSLCKIREKLKHPCTVQWNQRCSQTTSTILQMTLILWMWLSKIIFKKQLLPTWLFCC